MTEPKLRRGNIRRALKLLARRQGVALGHVKYHPELARGRFTGLFDRLTRDIHISTEFAQRPPEKVLRTAAHEYAHAIAGGEHGRAHSDAQLHTEVALTHIARGLRALDKGVDKRRSSGGDWDESKHPRAEDGKWTSK